MEKVVQTILPTKLLIPKLKKVCAYARVSSGKDAMINSLSAQISYITVNTYKVAGNGSMQVYMLMKQ